MSESAFRPNHLHYGADRLAKRIGCQRELIYQLHEDGWPFFKLRDGRTSPLCGYERDIAAKIAERQAAGRAGEG